MNQQTLILLSKGLHTDLSLIKQGISDLKEKSIKEQYFGLSDICKDKALTHPDWNLLSGRILIHEIKTEVPSTFSKSVKGLRSICHDDYYKFVMANTEALDSMIVEKRDWNFDILAVQTLLKSYLLRLKKGKDACLMETPQYMFLRVATYLMYSGSSLTRKDSPSKNKPISLTPIDLASQRIRYKKFLSISPISLSPLL